MLSSNSFNENVTFCSFGIKYLKKLLNYLDGLSPESRKRFGPHPFTEEQLIKLITDSRSYKLFIAINKGKDAVIAYTIVKMGWVDFDFYRLSSYQLSPEPTDCTIAPSVADIWQSKGMGYKFLRFVMQEMEVDSGIKRFILWGGVQADNEKAIGFYNKFNFRILGEFEHNGNNFDMILEI